MKLNIFKKKTIVFWVVFQSSEGMSDRIARFNKGNLPSNIFDWISEQRESLERKHGNSYVMINCGVIK